MCRAVRYYMFLETLHTSNKAEVSLITFKKLISRHAIFSQGTSHRKPSRGVFFCVLLQSRVFLYASSRVCLWVESGNSVCSLTSVVNLRSAAGAGGLERMRGLGPRWSQERRGTSTHATRPRPERDPTRPRPERDPGPNETQRDNHGHSRQNILTRPSKNNKRN